MGPRFQLHYKKDSPLDVSHLAKIYNDAIEKSFEDGIADRENPIHGYNPFLVRQIQNYNPIYSLFFDLNEQNYNKLTLQHPFGMNKTDLINRETGEKVDKPVYFKFAPLLDATRFMLGNYTITDPALTLLPTISNKQECFPKLSDPNNVSYIDSFFYYLSSQLKYTHNVMHAIEFYGSYLGVQELFKANITDELDYLRSSPFFAKHLNSEFFIDEMMDYKSFGSSSNRKRLNISSGNSRFSIGAEDIAGELTGTNEGETEVVYEKTDLETGSVKSSRSSSSSSAGSELNYSSEDEGDADVGIDDIDEDSESDRESDEYSQEEDTYAYIRNFPTQMICLEKCNGTLDELFESHEMEEELAASCLFQIVMTLILYQKAFQMTHNDLHTNNIMYVNTDQTHLFYCYNSRYYCVPTHGKIFKIIDFGRSIYKFQGKTFCSDSFAKSGDAYSQYNCEPYMNMNKPRIDPNPSFDLCRLGCSIFDFVMDIDVEPDDEFQKTISRWCTDDNGKNVIYKQNGEERYPGFKLYKMIARNVHRHTPQEQLNFPYFQQFELSPKKMKKYTLDTVLKNGINIDEIPAYW